MPNAAPAQVVDSTGKPTTITNANVAKWVSECAALAKPEKIVLLSNHNDAWVYGAVDPSSGTATISG